MDAPPRASAKEAETEQWIKSASTDSAGLPVLSYGRESTNAVWLCAFSFRLPKRLMKITALTVFSCVASRNKREGEPHPGLPQQRFLGRAVLRRLLRVQLVLRHERHQRPGLEFKFAEPQPQLLGLPRPRFPVALPLGINGKGSRGGQGAVSAQSGPEPAGAKRASRSGGSTPGVAPARATQRVAGARLIRPRRASPAPLMHRCARGRRFLKESRYSLSVQAVKAWLFRVEAGSKRRCASLRGRRLRPHNPTAHKSTANLFSAAASGERRRSESGVFRPSASGGCGPTVVTGTELLARGPK